VKSLSVLKETVSKTMDTGVVAAPFRGMAASHKLKSEILLRGIMILWQVFKHILTVFLSHTDYFLTICSLVLYRVFTNFHINVYKLQVSHHILTSFIS